MAVGRTVNSLFIAVGILLLSIVDVPTQGRLGTTEGRAVAAAMPVLLVAVGGVRATVIMNRFGDLLAPVEGPGTRASGI